MEHSIAHSKHLTLEVLLGRVGRIFPTFAANKRLAASFSGTLPVGLALASNSYTRVLMRLDERDTFSDIVFELS